MTNPEKKNYAASAYARLKNLANVNNCNLMHLLIRYATERFLYRLSVSDYSKHFVLKGGNLFVIWQNGQSYRPTIDSDLLYYGSADEGFLNKVFIDICNSQACSKDGMRFDTDTIKINAIREETEYGGMRVVFYAYLGSARIRLQFDIGVGDVITPSPEWSDFPVLLGGDVPRLRIYPKETAIAEKLETMVSRGMLNSRMKDFYDIWILSELFEFDFETLRRAIENTFCQRDVTIPVLLPDCFSEEFYFSPVKQTQWNAFCRKNDLMEHPVSLKESVTRISNFLLPVIGLREPQFERWLPDKGWM